MNRREFASKLAGSGAFAWLVVQQTNAQTGGSPMYANPVPFVANGSEAGLTAADESLLFTVDPAATVEEQAQSFPQSVASGDPSPNGVVLWTRLDPMVQVAGDLIGLQIASSSDFGPSSLLVQCTATLSLDQDNTVKLPISNTALQAFTLYYYRFIYNGIPSRTGRFKTLPAPGSAVPELKLGYVVCQDYGNGFYTALQYLAQEPVDYIVHLGDYIYETITSNFQGNPARLVPPFPSGSTTIPAGLDDYRHLYKVYRSDPDQQTVHENFAYIQLWDDHEFANDCHQDFHPDNNVPPNTADTPQPTLRQAANQAWSEYGLADVAFNPSADWESSIQVYRTFNFGSLADLIVTDERLYRDGPPCGDSQIFGRYFSFGCGELRDPNRSMLGATQKAWFMQQITSSTATWKLWANEVMLMQLKAAGFIYVDLDQWDGYPKERSALLSAFQDAGVQNLVALTGDLHTFLAGYLKPDFDNIFARPTGIELMVGSISSANLAEDIESAVDLPSSPMPAKQFGVPPNLLEPLIRLNNPHIEYWDSSTHGYGVLDLTPTQLICTFKAVTTIRATTADLVTLRTFTIPTGQVQLNQS